MTPIVTVVNTRLHVLTAWSSVTAIYRQQCSTSRRGYFELSFEIMKNETRPPMRAKQPQMPAGNVTSNPHTRKAPASSSDVCPVSFPQTSKANRGMKATANSRQAGTKARQLPCEIRIMPSLAEWVDAANEIPRVLSQWTPHQPAYRVLPARLSLC